MLRCLLFVTLVVLSLTSEAQNTTYYLIRHAEKESSNPKDPNPRLSKEGSLRAQKWSEVLSKVKLEAVYSTDYHRTRLTAQPTSEKQNVEIKLYDPRNLANEGFINATRGKAVLVVGHSNTTPVLANKLIGKQAYPMYGEKEYSYLIVITITPEGSIGHQQLVID